MIFKTVSKPNKLAKVTAGNPLFYTLNLPNGVSYYYKNKFVSSIPNGTQLQVPIQYKGKVSNYTNPVPNGSQLLKPNGQSQVLPNDYSVIK